MSRREGTEHRKIIIFLLTILFCIAATAEKIYIAPLICVSDGSESYEIDETFTDEILKVLNREAQFLGYEIVKTSKKIKQVRSSYDALRVCKESGLKYLIYGWIKKGEYTYDGELRFFDSEGGKTIFTIYERHSRQEYEDFIENISKKILKRMNKNFFISEKDAKGKHTKINMSTGIGYWTFVNKHWTKYIAGRITVQSGLEIIPNDTTFLIKQNKGYFSLGLSIEYLLGVNKEAAMKSYLHSINTVLYTNIYINFYEQHLIYGSFGVLYCLDILKYQDKYTDAKINTIGGVGILGGIGYKCAIAKKARLIFEVDSETIFYKKIMSKFRGKFGIEFEVYNKEYKLK